MDIFDLYYPAPGPRYCVSVDWLQIMFLGVAPEYNEENADPVEFAAGVVWEPTPIQGNRHFRHSWNVYLDGVLIATAMTHPRNETIMKTGSIQVKLMNNLLYYENWMQQLQRLIVVMDWEFNNISRLDIAIDGNFSFEHTENEALQHLTGLRHFMEEMVQSVHTRQFEIKGRVKHSISGHYWNAAEGYFSSYSIGSLQSDKSLVIYDKASELERSNKQYIREFWEVSGLDTNRPIERLEIRLKSAALKKIKEFDWTKLADAVYLATLARTNFHKWFDVVEITGDTNISRRNILKLIDWDKLNARLLEILAEAPTEVHRTKIIVKDLYLKTKIGYLPESVTKKLIEAYLFKCDLWAWHDKRLPQWDKWYEKWAADGNKASLAESYIDTLQYDAYEVPAEWAAKYTNFDPTGGLA